MSELNTFASLGPTLLARKGGAKPAMRSHAALADPSQVIVQPDLEDLGWNDMGDDSLEHSGESKHKGEVVPLTPAGARERISSRGNAGRSGRNGAGGHDSGHRAAFTLRLDGDRHLRLRLASTVLNRSAQDLVTEALDQYLAGTPEIDALAAQVKRD